MYAFEPDTLRILRTVMDDVVAAIRPENLDQEQRLLIARRLLTLAAGGERHPGRLKEEVLMQGTATRAAIAEKHRTTVLHEG
ncbi:hypothetical protein PQJ75_02180 [Rhodoplanes sp. TEM]|uniref:Uncharacterized protein n=1 Tax=Rhodoplanes tepidamans TaxID=200616 RepID=A0ABT5J5Y9_RHOTP|nr:MULTISPECIES: hypothetical protein [Rhodoplanes]MDC7785056.1 hypothetical protein [Rhodoplanes tepidamans]MDC7982530.1 hypothetical protein [Rhodoplanes sp. TEM]MDQ0356544.1 hypothetical protein [Rhodoplanes tepidamans]